MDWFLKVIDSPRLPTGVFFKLEPNVPSFNIGREKSVDKYHIRIPEANVSREHAIIFCKPVDSRTTAPFICDMGSVIGTFVNDIRISESRGKSPAYRLSHGDEILIGKTLFRVVQNDPHIDEASDCRGDFSDFEEDSPVSSYSLKVKRFAALSRMSESVETPESSEKDSHNIPFSPTAKSPISASNIGFKMLQKLGWQSGQGLGRIKQGSVEPIEAKFDGSDRHSRPSFTR